MPEEQQKTTEDVTNPSDPMAIALDLIMGTLQNLPVSSATHEKREAAANVIGVVQALALMDIANSVRELKNDVHKMRISPR